MYYDNLEQSLGVKIDFLKFVLKSFKVLKEKIKIIL